MIVEAGLVLSRFLHYAALLTLFGVSLFPLYAYPALAGKLPARVDRWRQTTILAAAFNAPLSWLSWLVFVVASMTGSLSGVADGDALWSVLYETGFGNVWMARFAVMAILLSLLAFRAVLPGRHLDRLSLALSAALLASLAAVGHTQMDDGTARIIHVSTDGLHLLGVGAWLGGLLCLFHLMSKAARTASADLDLAAVDAALRFSCMGYIAVGVITGSGLVNAWFMVGSIHDVMETAYGRILLVKLALFGGMLTLAAINRFRIVPTLMRDAKSEGRHALLYKLRNHILGEQALGSFIVLIVSVLGVMEPAIGRP